MWNKNKSELFNTDKSPSSLELYYTGTEYHEKDEILTVLVVLTCVIIIYRLLQYTGIDPHIHL